MRAIEVMQDSVTGAGRRIVVSDNEIEGFRDAVVIGGTIAIGRARGTTGGPAAARARGRRTLATRRSCGWSATTSTTTPCSAVATAWSSAAASTPRSRATCSPSTITPSPPTGRPTAATRPASTTSSRGAHLRGRRHFPHSFDVHGRGDANEEVAGGPAGTYFDVSFNTVLGEQNYGFLGLQTRAAFALRGRPARAPISRQRPRPRRLRRGGEAQGGDDRRLDEDRPSTFNLRSAGNRYDVDYSTELATGDFDRDGRTDVFVANGTAWFYSSAGIRPWQYLRASNKRIGELGFADIDNDGITDVLYRDPSGGLGYVKSGTAAPLTPLTSVPVPIKDLRFGDFDGDGLTDIFYTRGPVAGLVRADAHVDADTDLRQADLRLLFGEFDDVRGTDVVGSTPTAGPTRAAPPELGEAQPQADELVLQGRGGRLRRQRQDRHRDRRRTDVALQPRRPLAPHDDAQRRQPASLRRAQPAADRPLRRRHAAQGHQLQPHRPGHAGDIRYFPGEWLVIWRGLGSASNFSARSRRPCVEGSGQPFLYGST